MTTAAMVFGMLPLAIGFGEGSEQQAPMGRAIIGGVLTSTLLSLLVVPVIYSYLDRWETLVKTWFSKGVERRAAREAREEERSRQRPDGRGRAQTPEPNADSFGGGAVASTDPQAREES